jgi:hypothetical protein
MKQKKAEQLCLLSLRSEKQELRFLLLQCHAPPQSLCSTLFAAVYKRPTEGGRGAFAFAFWGFTLGFWAFFAWLRAFCFVGLFAFEYWEEAFTLGLLVWEAFGREKNC